MKYFSPYREREVWNREITVENVQCGLEKSL